MTVIWAGLSAGALYALLAMAFNIGIVQAGTFNFAVPQVAMVAALLAYQFTTLLGWPLAITVVGCVSAGAVLGSLVELAAIRYLRGRSGHGALVTTVGAAFALEGLAFGIWGPNAFSVEAAGSGSAHTVLGGRLSTIDMAVIIAAVVFGAVLQWMTTRAGWVLTGRAATADPDAALLRGINVRWNRTRAFAVAGALGGLIGVLAAMKLYASFDLGVNLLVYAFAALTLGGTGSYLGSLVGGALIGLAQALTARYVGDAYGVIVVFVFLLIVLLVRPAGILGRSLGRVV